MTVAEVRRQFEQLKQQYMNMKVQHITVTGNSFALKNGLTYSPSHTGKEFHSANDFVRAIMGPVGSGKSTVNCAEIILRAVRMPECIDGIRRSRWAIIRNTYGELETTTLATWLQWFKELGDTHLRLKTPIKFTSTFNDGNGNVELEVYFLALDRPEDVKKLESLELTGAFLNEARNIPRIVLERCQERVGRYPQKAICPQSFWSGVTLDTNPPDTESWFYQKFEVLRPKGYLLIKQPSGLIKHDDGEYEINPNAENLENLPKDYYLNAIIGRAEEHINVQVMGNYGFFIEGKLVYSSYNDDLHAIDNIDFIPDVPVLLSWDFGLTPSVLFSQLAPNGQMLNIKELCSEDMSLEGFIDNHVLPFTNSTLPNFRLITTGDPAGVRGSDADKKSCFNVLRNYEFDIQGASTNRITPRIDAVNHFLTRLISGKPAYQISKKGCPRLRKGFLGGYHLKRIRGTDDRFHDEPNKNEYSHIHDCLQYSALYFRGETKPKTTTNYQPDLIQNYAGLTV